MYKRQGQHVIFVYEEAGTVAGYASLSRYRERKAFDPAVEISIYTVSYTHLDVYKRQALRSGRRGRRFKSCRADYEMGSQIGRAHV